MSHVRILPLKWRPLLFGRDVAKPDYPASDRVTKRIAKVLQGWYHTPYVAGQQQRGVGVDCVRFFAGVVDELYGTQRVPLDRMPQDMAMHDREGAIGVLRTMLRTYPELAVVTDGSVEPMDVLVVAHPAGGPGHVMLGGPQRNTLWHAGTRHVTKAGWSLDGQWQTVHRVFRFANRRAWDI